MLKSSRDFSRKPSPSHWAHNIYGKKIREIFTKKLNYAASFTKFFMFINFVKLWIDWGFSGNFVKYICTWFFCLTYKVKDLINWVIYMNDISLQINRSSFEKLGKKLNAIHLFTIFSWTGHSTQKYRMSKNTSSFPRL